MGDTGSMFLGFMLSGISIVGVMKSAAMVALVVPVLALGLPIMDTTFAIVRRWLAGAPIMKPDKGHLHHRLLNLGLSQRQAVLLMYVISAILGSGAIFMASGRVPKTVMTFIFLGMSAPAINLPRRLQLQYTQTLRAV